MKKFIVISLTLVAAMSTCLSLNSWAVSKKGGCASGKCPIHSARNVREGSKPCLLGAGRCSQYDACSVHGDLSGATGAKLEMYVREKGEDGRIFTEYRLPEFWADDLQGNRVSSADLEGRPALFVFLAGHCNHSHDSIPILEEVYKTYSPMGLRVVGVIVNSGSVEDVNTWMPGYQPHFDVWVRNDDSLGDLLETHLVPAFFFVDADGQVREKLVGFKRVDQVDAGISHLLGDRHLVSRRGGTR